MYLIVQHTKILDDIKQRKGKEILTFWDARNNRCGKTTAAKKKTSILKLYDINETRKGGADRKHEKICYNILHTVCENKQ